MSRTAATVVRSSIAPYADRAATRDVLAAYRLDPWLHCDHGHVTILDLETVEEVEFRPYDHQREVSDAWIDLDYVRRAEGEQIRFRNFLEEKSRQMGLTWAFAWLVLWVLSYFDAPGLVQHTDFKQVDDGGSGSTPESFFGKVRFMWEHLPVEYQAALTFVQGEIKNPMRAQRYAVASGAKPEGGRGGRYKWVIIDEAARIPYGEAIHASIARACPSGRAYNSTPAGEGNVYFRLREQRPKNFTFLTHHWSRHPVYGEGAHTAGLDRRCELCEANRQGERWDATNPVCHRYPGKLTSPWYDEAVLELTDVQVAEELDIDYEGSQPARVYPEFSEQVHVVDDLVYDPLLEIELAFDYGLDVTSILVLQDHPAELRLIGECEVGREVNGVEAIPDNVAPFLVEALADLGVPVRLLTPEWTLQMLAIGDPAGESPETATGKSLVREWRRNGFAIRSPRRYTVAKTVNATKLLLMGKPKPLRVSSECRRFIRHAKANRWPTDRLGNRRMGATRTQDDEHNHAMRAFAYYVTYKWPTLAESGPEDSVKAATRRVAREKLSRTAALGLRYDMKQ